MNKRLRIGFDFDNTIICYGELFHRAIVEKNWDKPGFPREKSAIKEALVKEDGHDFRWQEIQAMVYAQLIREAKPFAGFIDTVKSLLEHQHVDVFVVSHKTKRSNYLKEFELIESALSWCEKQNLFSIIPKERWFFCPTRDEKIQKIIELNLDLFVDDLEEVLLDPKFPPIMKYLFDPQRVEDHPEAVSVAHWDRISADLRLMAHLGTQARKTLDGPLKFPLKKFEPIKRNGNNKIFKLTDALERKFIIKKYSQVNHSTLETEYRCLEFLSERGLPVPKVVLKDEEASLAVYEQIETSTEKPTHQEIVRDFSDFLARLSNIRSANFPEARDSRKTMGDYVAHLERRMKAIQNGCLTNTALSPIQEYMEKSFSFLFQKVMERVSLQKDEIIPASERMLSPSDFGTHNALFTKDRTFRFIDFEYFGWDDTAKLLADFIHHAGQEIDLETRLEVFKEFSQKTSLSEDFFKRFSTVLDLIGLEWILIILNVADPEVLKRRMYANPDLNLRDLVEERVKKAQARADLYRAHLASNSVFLTLNSEHPILREIQPWKKLIT